MLRKTSSRGTLRGAVLVVVQDTTNNVMHVNGRKYLCLMLDDMLSVFVIHQCSLYSNLTESDRVRQIQIHVQENLSSYKILS